MNDLLVLLRDALHEIDRTEDAEIVNDEILVHFDGMAYVVRVDVI